MPQMLENVITHVAADPDTRSVTLTWANGATTVSQFSHLVGRGVFAARANPIVFVQVRIGEHGRSLEWPGDIDVCADALWFAAHPEDAPPQASMAYAT